MPIRRISNARISIFKRPDPHHPSKTGQNLIKSRNTAGGNDDYIPGDCGDMPEDFYEPRPANDNEKQ